MSSFFDRYLPMLTVGAALAYLAAVMIPHADAPETEQLRPTPEAGLPKVFLAGDWTRTGWPATMEGAVRSGYLAAEAVAQAAGKPSRFLIPDIE